MSSSKKIPVSEMPVDHSGHRKRLKARVLNEGLDHFETHNLLELLLFYTIPRADTNETGHRLLSRFGSFSNVLDASVEALQTVPGVGHETALFLHMLPSVFRRYEDSKNRMQKNSLKSIDEAGDYMATKFVGQTEELFYALLLDDSNCIRGCHCIARGSVNSVNINIRKLVTCAVTSDATSVVLGHNHPSGTMRPSADDLLTTKRIINAMNIIGVSVLEHYIYSGDRYSPLSEDDRFIAHFANGFRSSPDELPPPQNPADKKKTSDSKKNHSF